MRRKREFAVYFGNSPFKSQPLGSPLVSLGLAVPLLVVVMLAAFAVMNWSPEVGMLMAVVPPVAAGTSVGEEVRAAMTDFKQEIKESVSGEFAERFEKTEKAIGDLKTELLVEFHKNSDPRDEKVKDLEKRLAEAEEDLRLMKVEAKTFKPDAPEKTTYKSVFFKDEEALRSALREMRNGNRAERAIDSSVLANGGQLNADIQDRFIDDMIAQQTTLPLVQVRRMIAGTAYIDAIGVTARKTRRGVEATAPSVANAISATRRTLQVVECIWGEDLTKDFLEESIERGGAEDHIGRLLATAFGNDQNDLAWNGEEGEEDSDGGDDFLAINTGWFKLAEADPNVTDVDASAIQNVTCKKVLRAALAGMPVTYKGRLDLAFFAPLQFVYNYGDEIADRQTAMGDAMLINGAPAFKYFGIPLIGESHFTGRNYNKIMFTPKSNLVYGIQRSVTQESEWKARTRVVEVTLTAKTDFNYTTGAAIVLVNSVPDSLVE